MLEQELEEIEYNIVHAHCNNTPESIIGVFIKKKLQLKNKLSHVQSHSAEDL